MTGRNFKADILNSEFPDMPAGKEREREREREKIGIAWKFYSISFGASATASVDKFFETFVTNRANAMK